MKKIQIKPIIVSIILIIFQSVCFALSKVVQGNPYYLETIYDYKISFNILAIIPYCIWYFMLIIVPYILYIKDKDKFIKYSISYCLMVIAANILFITIPSTLHRPEITGTSILELLTKFIFFIDTPATNIFPSLHCAMSNLWLLYIVTSKKTNMCEKIIVTIISISIMISTLVLKQHVLLDLISGDLISLLIFILVSKDKKLTKKLKPILL